MNERDEQQTGAALGRALAAQRIRETPFAASRLSAQLEHPRGAGLPLFQVAAFAAGFVLLVGGLYVAALRSQPGPASPSATPSGSAPVIVPSPGAQALPSATPLPGPLNHSLVYCARIGAPPFAVGVTGIDGHDAAQRIVQRLDALARLRPLGANQDGGCPMGFPSPARLHVSTVMGDTVELEYSGDWAHVATTIDDPLIQEIVYTATEEPGIRFVQLDQIGTLFPRKVICQRGARGCDTFAREDVLGYAVAPSTLATLGQGSAASATAMTRWSVDDLAPGLARFVIELAGVDPGGEPQVDVRASANDEKANPDLGKQTLTVTVHGVSIPESETIVDKTPLRSVTVAHEPGSATTVHFTLGLDDLRPWRVASLSNPARIVVDVGGPTAWVTQNLAVYAANVTTQPQPHVRVSGVARSFEANVQWRVKAGGAVVAQGSTQASVGTSAFFGAFETEVPLPASRGATLEVFLTSPKDGSVTDLVSIPIGAP